MLLVLPLVLQAQEAYAQSSAVPWVHGEYIVKYSESDVQQLRLLLPELKSYTDEQVKEALTNTLGATKVEDLSLISADAIKADAGSDIDIDAALDLIDADLVEYISPNYIYSANVFPNDPSYSSLWGLHQANDIDINAPEAWETLAESVTEEVVVGVVDTGVAYNHPDLAANVWVNATEANGLPNVDDDHNGVIDDIHGYNAITNSGDPFDDNNHGTHCSGTIAAIGDNGTGVIGVAYKAKIMGLKFLSSTGSGDTVNAVKAVNYAVMMRSRGVNLKVLSNSWGGGGFSQALYDAIAQANNAGILFVAAAGNANQNTDNSPNYPSGYDVPNVISVAAIDANGNRASFSNYGATTVDIAAPGVGILSTIANGSYSSFNGTSMATPHVSGVAALLYSYSPQYAPADLRSYILSTVKPIPALQGLMVAPGIVNARIALAEGGNYPPDLFAIAPQTISPNIRSKSIPIVAIDRENDPLTYTTQIVMPAHQTKAAAVDGQYDFVSYQPQYDNYYGIGEKRIVTRSGQVFFIFADGGLYELAFPYYYFRTSVDPLYYGDPARLVAAYPISTDDIATVQIEPGNPAELTIQLALGFAGSFSVSVTVSDGHRSDSETFVVQVKTPENCN